MSKKLQALNEVTSANDSDLLYLVRNTNGVYTDHKIAKSNLIGTIPVDTGDLTNNAGFITAGDVPTVPTDVSDLTDTTGIIPTDISSNVLLKDNTTEFVPDADYEPATKKYVDDNAGGESVDRASVQFTFQDMATDPLYASTLAENATLVQYGNGFTISTPIGTESNTILEKRIKNIFDRNPILIFEIMRPMNSSAYEQISVGGYSWSSKGFGLYLENGVIRVESFLTSFTRATSTTTVPADGQFHEIMLKLISGDKIETYYDGVLINTKTDQIPSGDTDSNNADLMKFQVGGGIATGVYSVRNARLYYDAVDPQLPQ